MIEFVIGVLLAAAAVWFVLQPIFRAELVGRGTREAVSGGDGQDADDDLSPRAVALGALREIEFDRATGKLSDVDYDALHRKYTAAALEALRAESGVREGPAPVAQRAPAVAGPSRGPSPGSPISHPTCPTHGPRPEPDAAFCSECGRRLAAAPGYCARCGSALETDARYCHTCGARIAA